MKELKLRPTANDWYSNSSWYEFNSMENPCQTHVRKKVSRANFFALPCPVPCPGRPAGQAGQGKKNKFALQGRAGQGRAGQGGRAAGQPCPVTVSDSAVWWKSCVIFTA